MGYSLFLTGLYRDWYKESRLDELFVVARTVFIGLFLLFLVTSASQIMDFVNTGISGSFLPVPNAPFSPYGSCMLCGCKQDDHAYDTGDDVYARDCGHECHHYRCE